MLSLHYFFTSCYLWVALVLLAIYLQRRQRHPRGFPFPPGPSPLPLVGNVHQAPKSEDWLLYTEWGRLYGPLVYFRLFSRPVILVNTYEVAIGLFQKRSGIYSDRPRFVMAAELIGWDQAIALAQSGPRHRKCRRLLSNVLNPVSAKKLWGLQESGAQKFLKRLEDDPQNFFSHIRSSVSETIVMIAFGHECSTEALPYVEMAESAHEKFTLATSPSAYVVDSLPLLRYLPEWFPGAGFKRQAREWNAQLQELVHLPYYTVKEDIDKGVAHPSYVSHHIDTDHPLSREDEDEVMWSAASLYTGGVDTTTAAVTTFILAMCLYPQAQEKAQSELDRVIGCDRLPTISDRENLPYVEACMKEVLRWHPVAPLGRSHSMAHIL